jgi:Na+-transporting methylmalonyl-CoA/oxaloacetate decarboxylase gamma subunit
MFGVFIILLTGSILFLLLKPLSGLVHSVITPMKKSQTHVESVQPSLDSNNNRVAVNVSREQPIREDKF